MDAVADTHETFLVFRAGASLCGLPVQLIHEIFRPLATEPLGQAPDFVLGMARVRGAAVPVVDLGRLLGRMVELLTVGETYFSRQWDHFRALIELAIPARLKARAGQRRLRILSAGCASGEEAYSMAMVLREHFAETAAWDLQILGV